MRTTAQPSPKAGRGSWKGPGGTRAPNHSCCYETTTKRAASPHDTSSLETRTPTAEVAAQNVLKTDEAHQLIESTNEVGGLGRPLGKRPAPSGTQSPLAASASSWRDSWGGGVAFCPPPRGGTLSDCATTTPAGRTDARLRRRGALEDKGSGRRHGLDLIIVPVNIRQSY